MNLLLDVSSKPVLLSTKHGLNHLWYVETLINDVPQRGVEQALLWTE